MLGEEVYLVEKNTVQKKIITTVRIAEGNFIYYGFDYTGRFNALYAEKGEEYLFKTKEELLKSL